MATPPSSSCPLERTYGMPPSAAATDDRMNWSKLLGMKGKEAKALIEKETGLTNVVYVPRDCGVTADQRSDRVRIYVDAEYNGDRENAKVIKVPMVG